MVGCGSLAAPRDVIIGPDEDRSVFADLAQLSPGAVGVAVAAADGGDGDGDPGFSRRDRGGFRPGVGVGPGDEDEAAVLPGEVVGGQAVTVAVQPRVREPVPGFGGRGVEAAHVVACYRRGTVIDDGAAFVGEPDLDVVSLKFPALGADRDAGAGA